MNGNMILLLPMILPLIAGLITGFLKEEKQCNLWVFIVMAVEAGLVWMLAFGDYTLEVWRFTDRLVIAYHTDGLAKFFACLISTVWLLAAVFSMEYMKHEHKPARFFMFYILSLGALMSLCFSANMMTMYLSYEYMTVLTLPPYGDAGGCTCGYEISRLFHVWRGAWPDGLLLPEYVLCDNRLYAGRNTGYVVYQRQGEYDACSILPDVYRLRL